VARVTGSGTVDEAVRSLMDGPVRVGQRWRRGGDAYEVVGFSVVDDINAPHVLYRGCIGDGVGRIGPCPIVRSTPLSLFRSRFARVPT